MKQKSSEYLRTASGSWRPLAVAIALIFMLGIATTMVSAQDDATAAGFNSPLPGPGGSHGGGNPVGDLLDGIVDVDELVAGAMGITVEELEAAKEEGTRIDELIDELGLDAETVRQAVQDAVEAAVEQAVADGLLTEEEAETILNGPGGSGQGSDLKDLLDGIVDREELLADALGITVEELDAAKEAGTHIDELIDELGLDAETVRQEVQDAFEATVEQAITDGLLTEEEAEAIVNRPSGQERRPGPDGPGRRGRPGGSRDDSAPSDDEGDDDSSGDVTSSGETTERPGRGPGPGPGGPDGRGDRS